MFIAKIGTIVKDTVQETGANFLDVPVDIYKVADDGTQTFVETRKYAFALTDDQEFITAELAKIMKVYSDDYQRAIDNAELDAAHAKADQTIVDLSNSEITPATAEQMQTPLPAEVAPVEQTSEATNN